MTVFTVSEIRSSLFTYAPSFSTADLISLARIDIFIKNSIDEMANIRMNDTQLKLVITYDVAYKLSASSDLITSISGISEASIGDMRIKYGSSGSTLSANKYKQLRDELLEGAFNSPLVTQ
jgi:hypothetical protein